MTTQAIMERSASSRLSTIFEISLYLMVGLSSVMLTLSEGLKNGPTPQLFTIPLLIIAYIVVDHWRVWSLPWWAAGGLGLLAMGLTFFEVSQFIQFQRGVPQLPEGQLLDVIFAGAHLLVFLTWIVLFLEKSTQQYWWLWALCLLQIAVGASQTTESVYGVLLSFYLFLGVWTLSVFSLLQGQQQFDRAEQTAQSMHSEAAETGNEETRNLASPLPRSLPSVDHEQHPLRKLWRRPSHAIGSVQRDPSAWWINARFLGGVLGTAGLAFVLGFLFFLLIPRHPAIWGSGQGTPSPGESEASMVGFSRELSLGDMGQILESTKKVMEVRLTDYQTGKPIDIEKYALDSGYEEPLFRGMTTLDYNNGKWRTGESDNHYNGGEFFLPKIGNIRGEMVRQDIRLEPIDAELLFAMPPVRYGAMEKSRNPIMIETLNDIIKRSEPDTSKEAVQYSILSPKKPERPGTLPVRQSLARIIESRRNSYQSLPGNLRNLQKLAIEKSGWLESPSPSEWDMSQRLLAYLKDSGEFQYTLNASITDPDIDPVEDFLFNRKVGHCEYFASALALMLRAVGIPSRLVSGFKGGAYNDITDRFVVEERHAHAWVEAYIDQSWVILDPTPATRAESVASVGGGPGGWTDFRNLLRDFWARSIVGLNDRQQRRLLAPIKDLMSDALAWMRNGRSHFAGFVSRLKQQLSSPERWISWQGGLVTFVLLSFLSAVVWVVRKLWRLFLTLRSRLFDPRGLGQTVEFYERFRRICAAKGLSKTAAQTPREFAREVRTALVVSLDGSEWDNFPLSLVDRYYHVRYGGGLLDPQTAEVLNQQLARFESLPTERPEPSAARS